MPVIARDAVASDHLVYAWPFPIGPEEHDVSCAEDELVVMCPAWLVGDRLGPGRHRWRTPDPSRPVSAYFVLTAPVEVSFDMITQFLMPTNGQPIRLRATGSLSVRCMDPALLVAQFVGLPFDAVNEGVLRSVSRSIERMLGRLLTRRVVHAGTPQAVTDPSMLSNIVEELIAYNPTAGAVFGVELTRIGHLAVAADDGSRPWHQMTFSTPEAYSDTMRRPTPIPRAETVPLPENMPDMAPLDITPPPKTRATAGTLPPPMPQPPKRDSQPSMVSGEIGSKAPRTPTPAQSAVSGEIGSKPALSPPRPTPVPAAAPPPATPTPVAQTEVSGEIVPKTPAAKKTSLGVPVVSASASASASGTSIPKSNPPTPPPIPPARSSKPSIPPIPSIPKTPPLPVRRAAPIEIQNADEPTNPGALQPPPVLPMGSQPGTTTPAPKVEALGTPKPEPVGESRGSILGIGVAHIGSSEVASGEITKKIAPGARVLVPGPNGLMQSATVRQLLQGYYELEVGGSGETIWVPVNGVVPE